MGLFTSTDKATQKTTGATVIAQGTSIIGGISTDGTLHVDGKIEGVILEANIVSIGKAGEIVGDIKANNLIVSGLFDGKINCNEVEILSSGRVIGEIQYNELTIETGGKFEGNGIRKGSKLTSKYKSIENKITNIINKPVIINNKPINKK
jgi:cytoskeletal protein CcmA (bactofilin family)